jgi:hypothetical protein
MKAYQSSPEGSDRMPGRCDTEHQVRLLRGGLSMLRSTVALICEQARGLRIAGCVLDRELEQIEELERQVATLVARVDEGTFLQGIKPAIRRIRGQSVIVESDPAAED